MQNQSLTAIPKQTDAQAVSEQRPNSQSMLLSMTVYAMGYPFTQLSFTVSAASPPSLLAGETGWETEKAMMVCKY